MSHHTNQIPQTQQSEYESSEDENEESEEQEQQDEDYEEVPGEFEDEYEHEEENWYIETPGQSRRSFSTRSSVANSLASFESRHRFMRKSIKKSIISAIVSDEEDVDYNDDQDLVDSLPDDIAITLLEYWQQMDEAYLPLEENSLQFITKTHKKLINYPRTFEDEFLKQLDEPDKRTEIAEGFKADFNRIPAATRITEQTKTILNTRVSELTVKLEGITEEKFAKSKRNAYKILSKSSLTKDSEKLAKLFGIILQAETDRFADTIKFINEHYYKTIAMDLGMPNKVKWKEIIDIGLIKKKFICQHFMEKCSLREDNESDSWKETENEESSSDSNVCGGGYRGEDLAMVCEDDEESTPTEELSVNSLFNLNAGEDEEMDFGDETKMNGEMKISLEFDNEEYLGEGGWDPYPPQVRISEESGGTGERSNESGNTAEETPESPETRQSPETRESQSQSIMPESSKRDISKDEGEKTERNENTLAPPNVASQGQASKSKSRNSREKSERKKTRPSRSEKIRKKSSQSKSKRLAEKRESEPEDEEEEEEEDEEEEYPEEYTEELDMEEVEVKNPEYYEDEEYPGEFWEGEGYGAARYSSGQKRESVKFDDKKSYIRDFFYDSDPSKQTDKSKVEQGLVECKDEGYFDEDEVFDDEDVFYDREEFFERDWDGKKSEKQCAPEPQYLHFAIFGREDDKNGCEGMSLLNRLLMKWTVQQGSMETLEEEIESKEEESVENEIFEVEEENPVLEEEVEEVEGEEEKEEEDGEGQEEEDEEGDDEEGSEEGNSETRLDEKRKSNSTIERLTPPPSPKETKTIFENSTAKLGGGDAHIHPSIMEFSDDLNLLKLHPNLNDQKTNYEDNGNSRKETVKIAQKRPLLEIFVSLHNEIWSGFESAFREARTNIDKVSKSLKQVVQRSYPKDEPRDPCEEEVDLHELISRGEAIKAKYKRTIVKPPVPTASKVQKRVHLKESIDGDEEEISAEVEMESSPDQEYDNEEEEELEGSHKSSVADLLNLQQQASKTSGEETENVDSTHEEQERKSSLAGSESRSERTKKRVSIGDNMTIGKKSKSVLERGDTGTVGEESGTSANEEKGDENERKNSAVDNPLDDTEKGSSDVMVDSNSPNSDHKTESSERTKSAYLERIPGETNIRLPDSPEPSPEEKKILKKAKHALLKSKLLNWEKTLEVEAERLSRQLAFIEYHAQTQFSLLKHLPIQVWEKSKTQATNVYMEELKRDVEIGEVFKMAIQDGSQLYGKFYVDRYDLKLLLNNEPPPIPLKYTDEFHSGETQSQESRKSRRVQTFDYEE